MLKLILVLALMAACVLLCNCRGTSGGNAPAGREPPSARKDPVQLEKHGDVRTDEYYWLRERDNPEVIAYLEAENAYTHSVMAHTVEFQEDLFREIKGRIKQDDDTVPYLKGGHYYYRRFEENKDYAFHCRRKGSLDAPEEIMIDGNALAEGQPFFSVAGFAPGSPAVTLDGKLLAYAVDFVGRRIYTLRFKNLETGADLEDVIPNVTGNMVWANDNRTIFYTRQDPVTLRPYLVYRHVLRTDPASDVLVYEEQNEEYRLRLSRTKSDRYVMIRSGKTLSTEYRYLDADDPEGEFTVFLAREPDHEYSVDHCGSEFFVRTNWRARNFRLMAAPEGATGKDRWRQIVPHREDVLLQGYEVFKDFLVISERREGLTHLRVRAWEDGTEHEVAFDETAYYAGIGVNPGFDTPVLRFVYSSLTTPETTYDYDMATREKKLLKRKEVLGGFDPTDYHTARLYATAQDGERIPVTILHRRAVRLDGRNPLLLYGYGSYGHSMDAWFNSDVISLVDRGFVYAIAHVRGGQEMGRRWYEDGKLLKKKNTFTDFIACAEFLTEHKYTSPDSLYARGASAGGLLMGAVANMRPDLFAGIVAEVPFVDVVTTMLDDTIPLTTSEYDEWGNPDDLEHYEYMISYSPYDNTAKQAYPHILVMAGLHDSQVQYFEPAKWAARLRDCNTGDTRVLLRTNMKAGHGGASARTEAYYETAFIYAFLLDLAGR